jgi:hypothetical protein
MAAFPSPPGATIAYRAQPFEKIVDVHWDSGGLQSFIDLFWGADMIDLSGGGAPPLYSPTSVLTMTVNVTNLPALGRTSLTVDPHVTGDPDFLSFQDQVNGGPFPDGGGQISGEYSLRQLPFSGHLTGSVSYNTTATSHWFNDAASVTVRIAANLRTIGVRDYGGYNWTAAVTSSAGGPSITGVAPSGGAITLTATMQFHPPSITLT